MRRYFPSRGRAPSARRRRSRPAPLPRPPSRSRDGRRAAARRARHAAGARSAARSRSRRRSRGRRRDRGRSRRRRGRRASACSITSRYGSHALACGLRPGCGGHGAGVARVASGTTVATGRGARVGGRLYGRFWIGLPPAPARTAHLDPRRLQIGARRLAAHARRLLDAPQRPAQPPQRHHLLSLLLVQDVGHPGGEPQGSRRRQRPERYDLLWPVFRRPHMAGFGCPPRSAGRAPRARVRRRCRRQPSRTESQWS